MSGMSLWQFLLLIVAAAVVLVVIDSFLSTLARWRNRRCLVRHGLHRQVPRWAVSWWAGALEAASTGSLEEPLARVVRLEAATTIEQLPWLCGRHRGYDVWVVSLGHRSKRVYAAGAWHTLTARRPTGLVLVELGGPMPPGRPLTGGRPGYWSWGAIGDVLAVAHQQPGLIRGWPEPAALLGVSRAARRVVTAMDDAATLADQLTEPNTDATHGGLSRS